MEYKKLLETISKMGSVSYFNPDYVIEIDHQNDGKGCKIVIQGGMTKSHYDTRQPDVVAKIINENEKLRK